jgi:hypothetical protein
LVVSLRNYTSEAGTVWLNVNIDNPGGSHVNDGAAEVRIRAGEELRVVLPAGELDGFDVGGHDWSRVVVRYQFASDAGRESTQTTELALVAGQVVPREEAIASRRQLPDVVLDSDQVPVLKQAGTFKACFRNVLDLLPTLNSQGLPTACSAGTPDPTGGGCVNPIDSLKQNHQELAMPGQFYAFTAPDPDNSTGSGFLDASGCTPALSRKTADPNDVESWQFRLYLVATRTNPNRSVSFMTAAGELIPMAETVNVPSSGNPPIKNVRATAAFRPFQAAVFLANNTFERVNLIGALPPGGGSSLRISPLTSAVDARYCHTGTESGCSSTQRTLLVHQDIGNERGLIAHETGHFIHANNLTANPVHRYAYSNFDAGNPGDGCLRETADMETGGSHDFNTIEWQSAAHKEGIADFFAAVTYNTFGPNSDCQLPKYIGNFGFQVAVHNCEGQGKTLEPCAEWTSDNFFVTGNELDWTKMYWDYLSDEGGNMATYMSAERTITNWPPFDGDRLGTILGALSAEGGGHLPTVGNVWEGCRGIQSGSACCMDSCGTCGGPGCSSRPGGTDGCCSGRILANNVSCTTQDAPCVIP